MVIKTFCHFVDSNMGVEVSSNGGLSEVVLPVSRASDLPWEKNGLPAGLGVWQNHTD